MGSKFILFHEETDTGPPAMINDYEQKLIANITDKAHILLIV